MDEILETLQDIENNVKTMQTMSLNNYALSIHLRNVQMDVDTLKQKIKEIFKNETN